MHLAYMAHIIMLSTGRSEPRVSCRIMHAEPIVIQCLGVEYFS